MSLTFVLNGFREKVPTEPNKPIGVAFEKFCSSRNLDPSKFLCKSGKNRVDLSLPLRLSGLTANSVLEVLPNNQSEEGSVKVAIQVGNQPRVLNSFPSSMTLSGIILSFVASGSVQADIEYLQNNKWEGVVLVYMRTQVVGSDLLTTTLSSLGIVSGSVSFRVTLPGETTTSATAPIKSPSPVVNESPKISLESSVGSTEKIAFSSVHNQSSVSSPMSSSGGPEPLSHTDRTPLSVPVRAEPAEVMTPEDPSKLSSSSSTNRSEPGSLRHHVHSATVAIKRMRDALFDEDVARTIPVIVKIFDNLLLRPDESVVRSLKLSNPRFLTDVAERPGALDILRAVGFTDVNIDGVAMMKMLPENENSDRIIAIRDILAVEATKVGTSVPPTPLEAANEARRRVEEGRKFGSAVATTFDPFKPMLMKMEIDSSVGVPVPGVKVLGGGSESSAGTPESVTSSPFGGSSSSPHMTDIERRVEGLRARAREIIAAEGAIDRKVRIIPYNPSSGNSNNETETSAPIASDAADASLQMEVLRRKLQQQKESSDGFKTHAMRDLEYLQKARVYSSTVIRVQFPDRTVLRATFSTLEPVSALFELLQSFIGPEDGDCSFFLYQTPPPLQLARSSISFADAKLQPAVLLHLGWGKDIKARRTRYFASPADMFNANGKQLLMQGDNSADGAAMQVVAAAGAPVRDTDEFFPSSKPLIEPAKPVVDDAAVAALLAGGSVRTTQKPKTGSGLSKKPAWLQL